jgi:methionyl-tRNA formyltransferase
MKENKFAFFGTPEVARETLEMLFKSEYKPSVIITSPDRRSGRGMQMAESPVSIWAKEHNIKILKPEKIDDDFIKEFESFGVDLSIVIAYGKIIPEALIDLPRLGTINIHYSLLPRYRGASPVEETLLNDDKKTGVSIQQMKFRLDSGPIIKDKEVDIEENEVKTDLLKRLTMIGGELLVKTLPEIFEGKINLEMQDESKATYCKKIRKEDGLLNLDSNAKANYNKYRAFYGWPGTYFFKNNKRIKITKAKYENDSFIIERVIPEGKKEISYSDFLKSNI